MKLGFYPGCSLEGSSREYNESTIAIAEKFDIELVQIPDWNCCGATAAHNLDKKLSLLLPARNLVLAEEGGLKDVVVPCAACFSRLSTTHHELLLDEELRHQVDNIFGKHYKGSIRILNVIQFIHEYILEKLDEKIVNEFRNKVACYYGCLLVRPHKILNFDRTEDPQTMDLVMKKLGAEPIDWAYKTECCGAGFSVSFTDAVSKLSGKIVEDAIHRGAEAIIVACPMCQSNLDMRRCGIDKYLGKRTNIPVLYITQAIGLALGMNMKQLGLHRHFVPVNFDKFKLIKKQTKVEEPQKMEEK
ncbi:MAG TPA: CoB--CoM heterodisulfide reductase iron-sulfur subunit B family protein [Bacteroidales bacterium]|jgi:heterodisulfide reductase subunit B|nr:CoB--CoM heterodisulfide reductase iron-sulfur subunit B family protein [Bacteroidales bacterium]MDI9574382.1 CoB--CoM heterodisulfide reductase iron-sulfur subunit B family protein [Bacteroidota bacterium]OQC61699.1 MAG: succinate dehydrogenase/fumarate reductase iron-sulfur subunit [Bacteroidetes bacterium ADurb.Bin012]MBP9511338.1 CoB--CoM heterodisulfide reductase iron-sulfur subunit B family protein [Bacteroidales bacterium]MBP9587861.1 CoB--CoM heterodisulfide reductase iron-sulfur sub